MRQPPVQPGIPQPIVSPAQAVAPVNVAVPQGGVHPVGAQKDGGKYGGK